MKKRGDNNSDGWVKKKNDLSRMAGGGTNSEGARVEGWLRKKRVSLRGFLDFK